MQPAFRITTLVDRPAWVALRFELWPECPADRHELEVEQLLSSDGIVVVADVGGQLVGFAELSIRHDHVVGTSSAPVPYLEGWYVRAEHRGHGIGRRLLDFAERWATGRGYSEIASDAEIQNHQSIRLHRSLGFIEVERSVHFVKKLAARNA